ncbi:MAG: hypothetical protein KDK97_16345 [Verrucomicrobiales bacterium]|nr:hypothetical protein [Verrucomicrobiales bacterium]
MIFAALEHELEACDDGGLVLLWIDELQAQDADRGEAEAVASGGVTEAALGTTDEEQEFSGALELLFQRGEGSRV